MGEDYYYYNYEDNMKTMKEHSNKGVLSLVITTITLAEKETLGHTLERNDGE